MALHCVACLQLRFGDQVPDGRVCRQLARVHRDQMWLPSISRAYLAYVDVSRILRCRDTQRRPVAATSVECACDDFAEATLLDGVAKGVGGV